jgi:preprotein translocase SecE subunit
MANKKFKAQTGGLQEKKVHVDPTPEELKAAHKEEKAKRKEKAKERRKDKVGMVQRMRDVGGELKKVRWPSFATTLKQTGVVLGVVLAFALVVFAIDQGLGQLFKLLTKGLV